MLCLTRHPIRGCTAVLLGAVVRRAVIKLILSNRFRLSVAILLRFFSLLSRTIRGERACSVTRIVRFPGSLVRILSVLLGVPLVKSLCCLLTIERTPRRWMSLWVTSCSNAAPLSFGLLIRSTLTKRFCNVVASLRGSGMAPLWVTCRPIEASLRRIAFRLGPRKKCLLSFV